MLLSYFESIVAAFLQPPRNDRSLQEISDFLPKEYFVLNLHGVSEIFALEYFFPCVQSGAMKHFVIAIESLHHGLEEASIEHKGGFMHRHH